MRTVVKRVDDKVEITITAAVSIPFKAGIDAAARGARLGVPGKYTAPEINYDYKIVAWAVGKEAHYQINGRHDGFPAHSVYVNDEAVHQYKPADPHGNPSAVLGLLRESVLIDEHGEAK